MTEKRALLEDRVQETVAGVKHAFDLPYQVEQRPWLMLGGSLLVGYTLGLRGGGSSTTADTSSEPSSRAQPQQRIVSEVRNQVGDELAAIKGAFFGAVVSTLWAMAKQVLPLPGQPIEVPSPSRVLNPWKAHKLRAESSVHRPTDEGIYRYGDAGQSKASGKLTD